MVVATLPRDVVELLAFPLLALACLAAELGLGAHLAVLLVVHPDAVGAQHSAGGGVQGRGPGAALGRQQDEKECPFTPLI